MFTAGFQKGVGGVLGIPPSAVNIVSITTITARRLDEENYHHRPFLQSVSSSLSVFYTVSVSGRSSKELASTMTAQAASISTSLVSSGFVGASAQEAVESASSPSPSPTPPAVSASGTTRSNMYLSSGILCVALMLSLW
jgi:hypothetical protein